MSILRGKTSEAISRITPTTGHFASEDDLVDRPEELAVLMVFLQVTSALTYNSLESNFTKRHCLRIITRSHTRLKMK